MVRTAAFFRQFEALAIAGRQQLRLAVPAVAIHRAYRVEHVLGRQLARGGGHGAAGGTAADPPPDSVQLAHDLRAAGAMDGAIHAAASRQRRVGRVHNGIRRYARDIAFSEDDLSPRPLIQSISTYDDRPRERETWHDKNMRKSPATNGFSLAIEYYREEDGRWLADIPALPGVIAHGRTKKGATAAVEVLALRLIADRLDHGEAIPGPFNLSFIAA